MLKQLIPSPNNKTSPIVFQTSSSSLSRSLSLIKPLPVSQKIRRIRCGSEVVETQQAAAMSATPVAVEEQQVALSETKGDETTVKVEVNVKMSTNISLTRGLDDIGDLLGRSVLLELVSAELDPETGDEREIIGAYAHKKKSQNKGEVKYEGEFSVPKDFGEIGAILVENAHHKEMYIKDIILVTGDETTALYFDCRSWVHSKFDNPEKRIFFTTKMYLPSETPSGLQKWRTKELETLRGDGTGERKCFERIYDYDTYNDLGDPNIEGRARPVIGGSKELPYPRRCRTGRPKTKKGNNLVI